MPPGRVGRRPPLCATADSLLASLSIGVPTFPAAPPVLSPAAQRQLASLQGQVASWQRATEALPPLFVVSPSLAEYAPLAAQLGVVAGLLSQRLAQLAQGQPLVPAWQAAARLQLEAAQKPAGQAELGDYRRGAAVAGAAIAGQVGTILKSYFIDCQAIILIITSTRTDYFPHLTGNHPSCVSNLCKPTPLRHPPTPTGPPTTIC